MAGGDRAPLEPRDVAVLLEMRGADPSPRVRRAAAVALGRLPLDPLAAAVVGIAAAGGVATGDRLSGAPPMDVSGPESDVPMWVSDPFDHFLERAVGPSPALVVGLVRDRLEDGSRSIRDVLEWVGRYPDEFEPPVSRLAVLYARLLARHGSPRSRVRAALGPVTPSNRLHRQVAWLVARAPAAEVLAVLRPRLLARERDRRLAATCLIAEAAPYFRVEDRPRLLSGEGAAAGGQPRPGDSWPLDDESLSGARLRGAPTSPTFDQDVQFTVYRPGIVAPDSWFSLYAFAHRTLPVTGLDGTVVDPVAEVRRQARALLGDSLPGYGRAATDSSSGLPRGDEIVFVPWLDTAKIDHPQWVALRWQEPVHRAEFRLRVPATSEGQNLSGRVSIFRGRYLLLGEVRFTVTVLAGTWTGSDQLAPSSARAYRSIFASYSHADTEIVRGVAEVVRVTGDRYVIDVDELRAGERWEPRLATLIEQADMFQLFWSRHSMHSAFVRQEWEHALRLKRDAFVRPVYWEEPFPEADGLPPEELRRFQFTRLPGSVTGRPCCDRCGATAGMGDRWCRTCGDRIGSSSEQLGAPVRRDVDPSDAAEPASGTEYGDVAPRGRTRIPPPRSAPGRATDAGEPGAHPPAARSAPRSPAGPSGPSRTRRRRVAVVALLILAFLLGVLFVMLTR